MLDDLKLIHERDAGDALGFAEKQWQQLLYDFDVKLPKYQVINNIVWSGLGGSALPAEFSLNWPGSLKPFEICRSYDIPSYVSEDTLFIAASHSGNTEETLKSLSQAIEKKCQIIVISAGGKLAEEAKKNSYPFYQLPDYAHRFTNLFFIRALIDIYEQLGLAKGLSEQLKTAVEGLRDEVKNWLPDVATKQNLAKQLALELVGKSVVIYSGPKMSVLAHKLKVALNESAKNIAWWNQLPEFIYNELTGWSGQPLDKPYAVVDIRSGLEPSRVQKQFELAERLLSGKRPAPNIVEPVGQTLLDQLLWGLIFSDFVAIYLAILNGVNPTSLELAEKFKTELDNTNRK